MLYKEHFDALTVPYRESDHHYFQSIYLLDPDGYEVELTMATGKGDWREQGPTSEAHDI